MGNSRLWQFANQYVSERLILRYLPDVCGNTWKPGGREEVGTKLLMWDGIKSPEDGEII